jgi:hypothetical protein
LAIAQPSVFGLLVVADLGAFVEGFGQAVPMPLTEYFAEKNIEVIDWPPDLTSTKSEGIRVSVIPQSVTAGWLAEAGVLESAESDSECLALVE